jgi:hypothetical protein
MLDERSTPAIYEVDTRKRVFEPAPKEDPELGPLMLLPGIWKNTEGSRTDGRGWNLIALPFHEEGQFRDYRLLMNQYNEELRFTFVDDMVPNRGRINEPEEGPFDQFVVTLDYQQTIRQIAAEDSSGTPLAGLPGLPIHHEPGLFLHMKNRRTDGIDVARLATIPHGNAVTAIGKSKIYDGPPQDIDDAAGFPEGAIPEGEDINAAVDAASEDPAYLRPYNQFTVQPFRGIFSVKTPFDTLKAALGAFDVKRTTELRMDTSTDAAGIRNIPFIERQADANLMRSTFYIMELNETDEKGEAKLALAYAQFIFLDFFPRRDDPEKLIRWPHISINVMEKVAMPTNEDPYMVKYSKY